MSHEPLTVEQLAAVRVALDAIGSTQEYARIHHAARKAIARACERCGSAERVDAALRPVVPMGNLRVEPSKGSVYSVNLSDYHALCHACHLRLDLVERRPNCRHGHPYDAENTLLKGDGSRRCRRCHSDQERRRLQDPVKRESKRAGQRVARKPLTAAQRERKTELQRQRRAAAVAPEGGRPEGEA